jgi:hypothetical protein
MFLNPVAGGVIDYGYNGDITVSFINVREAVSDHPSRGLETEPELRLILASTKPTPRITINTEPRGACGFGSTDTTLPYAPLTRELEVLKAEARDGEDNTTDSTTEQHNEARAALEAEIHMTMIEGAPTAHLVKQLNKM